jgi:hypothetical protein
MAHVSEFPSGGYPIGQFPGGEYPLGAGRRARSRRSRLRGFGDTVVYEGGSTGWPPKDARPQDWLYTIGGMDPYTIGNGFKLSRRSRGLRGLGDDTPDAIRIYVPRLAAGLYAIDLFEAGLTPDAMPPIEPIATSRWNNRLATKLNQEARRLLGFVPVIHEPEGADVIYVHMAGATNHSEAERIWGPMQRALNQARNATGVGAPADPYAAQPRAWEATPPLPGPAPAAPERPRSVLDLVLGVAMVVGGIVLF